MPLRKPNHSKVSEQVAFRLALLLSFVLHCFPFILMILLVGGGGKGSGNRKLNGGSPEEKIEPKMNPNEPIEVEVIKLPGFKKKQPAHAGDKCPNFFGGIGVVSFSNTAMEVPEGYPAALAGIKPGDKLITPMEQIRGEVGTDVTIEYENETGPHSVTLTRDKICLSQKSKK